MSKPSGFVPLKSLKEQAPAPGAVLAEIRHIYFKTTRQTIEHDFDHAIALLKRLDTEEEREKATVYMHGLSEMRKEWGPKGKGQGARGKGKVTKVKAKVKTRD
jgi:hypothetical protein